jgi:hypothetical protein
MTDHGPFEPSRIFHNDHVGERIPHTTAAVRMPRQFVNMRRFGTPPWEQPNHGFDPHNYSLKKPLTEWDVWVPVESAVPGSLAHLLGRPEALTHWERASVDVIKAMSNPADRTYGVAPRNERLIEIDYIPHPMFFQDDILPRLLNDTPLAMLRRAMHVDTHRLMCAAPWCALVVQDYMHNLTRRRIAEARRAHLRDAFALFAPAPKLPMPRRIWEAKAAANAGILRVCLNAWQCWVSQWACTNLGVEEKWETQYLSYRPPRHFAPTLESERGQRRKVGSVGHLARQHGRWRYSIYYLLRINRMVMAWKWLVTARYQDLMIVQWAGLAGKGTRPVGRQEGKPPIRHGLARDGRGRGVGEILHGLAGDISDLSPLLRYRTGSRLISPGSTRCALRASQNVHRVSQNSIPRWMEKRFRSSSLFFDLHIRCNDFLDQNAMMGKVLDLIRVEHPEVVLAVENLHKLSAHTPVIMAAVIGSGGEAHSQTLFSTFCSLFAIRHTYVGKRFWLFLRIPTQQIAAALVETLQGLMGEVLHHVLLAAEAQDDPKWEEIKLADDRTVWHEAGTSRNVFYDFVTQSPGLAHTYLLPLVTFIWTHRREALDCAQIIAFFGSGGTAQHFLPDSLWGLSWNQPATHHNLWTTRWPRRWAGALIAIGACTIRGGWRRDRSIMGLREAIRTVPLFQRGEVWLLDELGHATPTQTGLLSDEAYPEWEEWWHCKDTLTLTAHRRNPYRLDTASEMWLRTVDEASRHLRRCTLEANRMMFSKPGPLRYDLIFPHLTKYYADQDEDA